MRKIEYKVEKLLGVIPKVYLDDLGKDGWELVSILEKNEDRPEPDTMKHLYYFKREIS